MINMLKKSINELKDMLEQMYGGDHYTQPIQALGNATIGEHTRHIIEFFQVLIEGYEPGVIDYENRKRDNTIETDPHKATTELEKISNQLDNPDKEMFLTINNGKKSEKLLTSFYRELYHNFEHCVHHQALIRVGLREMKMNIVTEEFGFAPSTVEYRKQCVQ